MSKKNYIKTNYSNTSVIKSRCKLCGSFYEYYLGTPGHFVTKQPTKPLKSDIFRVKMRYPDSKVVPFDCTIRIDGLNYNASYHKHHKKQEIYWEQEFLYCGKCFLSKIAIQVKARKNKFSSINRCGRSFYPKQYLD
jgi:hypothetical protein